MIDDETANSLSHEKLDLILAELRSFDRQVTTLECQSFDPRPYLDRILEEVLALRAEIRELLKEMRG